MATVLKVALPLPLPALFDYLPDAGEADASWVGCRVWARFGQRRLLGVVAGSGPADLAVERLRPIEARVDRVPLLDGELWQSLHWLAGYYHAPLGEVLNLALPGNLRQGAAAQSAADWQWLACASAPPRLRAGSLPARLWTRLTRAPATEAELDAELPGWRSAARSLAERGAIRREAAVVPTAAGRPGPPLNPEQQAAVAAALACPGFRPLLLDGVTGSGKTEVYLEMLAHCLAQERQALVLVPEIGLTPQTLARFQARLGARVLALHSGLAEGERARAWATLAEGRPMVVVGTRSAVFCPLPRAGLIVVDEEHDPSYKQQDGVRYSARDFALVRGKALDVPVLLGSATPSLESLAQAAVGRYQRLELRRRAGSAQPPTVEIVDLRRQALDAGLASTTRTALAATLAAGGQALVFKNRRGYAPVLLCHDCGWSAQCTRCERPLTVHRQGRQLLCHHCGSTARPPSACPACGGLGLQPQGVGTERLEQALVAAFPQVPVIRIDRETTRQRDGVAKQLQRLGNAPGILVGTQMLAKGHDLPQLDLVAVVGVDEGLFSADFRASERLAQLLIQVAGRAGRAGRPGRVLLQTHHPQHPLLTTLLSGGYPAFAAAALDERRATGFPPFGHLALLRAEALQMDAATAFLAAARQRLARFAEAAVEAHGPLPAPMPLRAGRHRAQLLLSAAQRGPLQRLLGHWVAQLYALPEARRVRWSLDVDPVDLY